MPIHIQENTDSAKGDAWRPDTSTSWHPFTQMKELAAMPNVFVERGMGCWLVDIQGRRYLDGCASTWTNVHGHAHPELNAVVEEQLGKIAHSTYLGLAHKPGNRLEHKLVEITPPSLSRVFFSDNGSSSVEIALKLSFQYWQLSGRTGKTNVIAMNEAYHGDTFGAMSVGGSEIFHGRFQHWCFPVTRFPRPSCREVAGEVNEACDTESLEVLSVLLDENADQTAAVILEPWVQGAAGMQLQPKGFLKRVADLCREHGVHLILDEVFTGFGRLGPVLVCTETGVNPDFLCIAKGLTAGYMPLAATLATEEIFEAFLGDFQDLRHFFHGHTFTANPLGAAVSLKSIELLEEMIRTGEYRKRMDFFGQTVQDTFTGHRNVAEVRQRGFACALDLCPSGQSPEPFSPAHRVGMKVCLRARDLGLLLRPIGDTLLLVPPLIINEEEIDFLCSKALQAINDTLSD